MIDCRLTTFLKQDNVFNMAQSCVVITLVYFDQYINASELDPAQNLLLPYVAEWRDLGRRRSYIKRLTVALCGTCGLMTCSLRQKCCRFLIYPHVQLHWVAGRWAGGWKEQSKTIFRRALHYWNVNRVRVCTESYQAVRTKSRFYQSFPVTVWKITDASDSRWHRVSAPTLANT